MKLTSYTKKEKENYENGKVKIVTNQNDIYTFFQTAKKCSSNEKLYFGKINKKISDKILKDTNISLLNYNVSLKADSIRHILKSHGKGSELLRGQVPICYNDFKKIPKIICNYETIKYNKLNYFGKPVLTFTKLIDNKYYIVNYVSDKKHTLEIQTMWKQKNNPATVSNTYKISPTQTSETNSGTGC